MDRRTSRTTAVAALMLVAVVAGLAPAARGRTSAAISPTPDNRVLVVTANLQEAFRAADLRDMSEMKVFVARLLDKVPFYPDVLLLQDVRKKSAAIVANTLSSRTGQDYGFAVSLNKEPIIDKPDGRRYETDTAIVINRTTTAKLDNGGYVNVRNPWPASNKREYERFTYVATKERSTDAKLAVMSIHFPYKGSVEGIGARARKNFKAWAVRSAKRMAGKYPGAEHIIAGDFNQSRCFTDNPCRISPFWNALVKSYRYTDGLWSLNRTKPRADRVRLGVDILFSSRDPILANGDDPSGKGLYSNHRFFWVMVPTG